MGRGLRVCARTYGGEDRRNLTFKIAGIRLSFRIWQSRWRGWASGGRESLPGRGSGRWGTGCNMQIWTLKVLCRRYLGIISSLLPRSRRRRWSWEDFDPILSRAKLSRALNRNRDTPSLVLLWSASSKSRPLVAFEDHDGSMAILRCGQRFSAESANLVEMFASHSYDNTSISHLFCRRARFSRAS